MKLSKFSADQIEGALKTAADYVDNPHADATDLALLLADISDALYLETGTRIIDGPALYNRFNK